MAGSRDHELDNRSHGPAEDRSPEVGAQLLAQAKADDGPGGANGTVPLPVWSSNRARHRFSRNGNRQLNAAIHRIALAQARCHPDTRALLARKASGDGTEEQVTVP
ncbi:Transposase IS116/IS110/IS902 family protein [Rhodococcus jostii]|uniref:Transposase IS116/IS110/IS902 family protein n=1 Tax=Rhodococcus jostii TaxID=132919 RepID=A0A1H4RYV4_RHOJO|nr:Transposase IS116/IS110/IS902 family protein [Rhodococcus jostii]